MSKAYIITQTEMDDLNQRIELAFLRDAQDPVNTGGEDNLDNFQKSDLYRKFNYEIRSWQSDVGK